MANRKKATELKITGRMPVAFPRGNDPLFPSQMAGATIVSIGTAEEVSLEEQGLIIDYIPKNNSCTERAIFGFNDLGLWLNGVFQIRNRT